MILQRKLENESLCVRARIPSCRSPVSLLSGVVVGKQWAHCVESWQRWETGGGRRWRTRRRQELKAGETRCQKMSNRKRREGLNLREGGGVEQWGLQYSTGICGTDSISVP